MEKFVLPFGIIGLISLATFIASLIVLFFNNTPLMLLIVLISVLSFVFFGYLFLFFYVVLKIKGRIL
jgi:hypothetical protein